MTFPFSCLFVRGIPTVAQMVKDYYEILGRKKFSKNLGTQYLSVSPIELWNSPDLDSVKKVWCTRDCLGDCLGVPVDYVSYERVSNWTKEKRARCSVR